MKIVIAHLFPDTLNLYGENGNVMAIKSALKMQNVDVEVREMTFGDESWDFSTVDFIYIGSGTENNEKAALLYMKQYKDELAGFIESGKFVFATGNSIELFGASVKSESDGSEEEMLDIIPFETLRMKSRVVGECVFSCENIKTDIIGFFNHMGKTINQKESAFKIKKGILEEEEEGVIYRNFTGTYLIGPVLVRNPELLEGLCRKLIVSKEENFSFRDFDFELERKAHEIFLEKYQ